MEVTPEAADGASQESQAGKGDSPQHCSFLDFFCSQKVNQGTIQSDKNSGFKNIEGQILNDFGFWMTEPSVSNKHSCNVVLKCVHFRGRV